MRHWFVLRESVFSGVLQQEGALFMLKKSLFLSLFCAVSATFTAAAAPANDLPAGKMFMCSKCSVMQIQKTMPAATKCNFKGKHDWFVLAEAGKKLYFCNKCEIMLPVKQKPNVNFCPRKGKHQWVEMAEIGPLKFQCSKCKFDISVKKAPKNVKCSKGGKHVWVQK